MANSPSATFANVTRGNRLAAFRLGRVRGGERCKHEKHEERIANSPCSQDFGGRVYDYVRQVVDGTQEKEGHLGGARAPDGETVSKGVRITSTCRQLEDAMIHKQNGSATANVVLLCAIQYRLTNH